MGSLIENSDRVVSEFIFCQVPEGDRVLKETLSVALSTLYIQVPREMMKDIEITGSLANGEGTVITTESGVMSSDLDILVSLKLPYYLIAVARSLDRRISEIATSRALSKGIKTHVCFTLYSSIVQRITRIVQKSLIYDYEFHMNKSLTRKSARKWVRLPSREDALQLVFTTIAEYLILYPRLTSQVEKVYWSVKRYLTLLYSMLIFVGEPRLTYKDRVKTALSALPPEILTPIAAKLASVSLDFKLTGNLSGVFRALGSSNLEKIASILESNLVGTVTRILAYQLAFQCGNDHHGLPSQDLLFLLDKYFARTRKSIAKMSYYSLILSLISVTKRRSSIIRMMKLGWKCQHSLLSVANYFVGLTLLCKLGYHNAGVCVNALVGLLNLRQDSNTLEKLWAFADELKYVQ